MGAGRATSPCAPCCEDLNSQALMPTLLHERMRRGLRVSVVSFHPRSINVLSLILSGRSMDISMADELRIHDDRLHALLEEVSVSLAQSIWRRTVTDPGFATQVRNESSRTCSVHLASLHSPSPLAASPSLPSRTLSLSLIRRCRDVSREHPRRERKA